MAEASHAQVLCALLSWCALLAGCWVSPPTRAGHFAFAAAASNFPVDCLERHLAPAPSPPPSTTLAHSLAQSASAAAKCNATRHQLISSWLRTTNFSCCACNCSLSLCVSVYRSERGIFFNWTTSWLPLQIDCECNYPFWSLFKMLFDIQAHFPSFNLLQARFKNWWCLSLIILLVKFSINNFVCLSVLIKEHLSKFLS